MWHVLEHKLDVAVAFNVEDMDAKVLLVLQWAIPIFSGAVIAAAARELMHVLGCAVHTRYTLHPTPYTRANSCTCLGALSM